MLIHGAAIAQEEDAEETGFAIVETLPQYPGGEAALMDLLKDNIVYPPSALKDGKTGSVYVSFTVDTTGAVTDVHVVKGVRDDLDREAMRVIDLMERWTPGTQKGKPVPVRFYFKDPHAARKERRKERSEKRRKPGS